MVTEFATFRVERGCGPRFEAAFAGVASLLTGADGYLRHRLVPTLDEADLFLLQVEWRDLAAHTEGFEPSEAHEQFITALAPLLVEEPAVVHIPTDQASESATSCSPRWMNGDGLVDDCAGASRPSAVIRPNGTGGFEAVIREVLLAVFARSRPEAEFRHRVMTPISAIAGLWGSGGMAGTSLFPGTTSAKASGRGLRGTPEPLGDLSR